MLPLKIGSFYGSMRTQTFSSPNTFKGNFEHALQVITNQPVCYVAIPGTFPAAVAHHRGTDGCLGTSWKSVKPRSYPKSTIG